jgi:hypothetical protein
VARPPPAAKGEAALLGAELRLSAERAQLSPAVRASNDGISAVVGARFDPANPHRRDYYGLQAEAGVVGPNSTTPSLAASAIAGVSLTPKFDVDPQTGAARTNPSQASVEARLGVMSLPTMTTRTTTRGGEVVEQTRTPGSLVTPYASLALKGEAPLGGHGYVRAEVGGLVTPVGSGAYGEAAVGIRSRDASAELFGRAVVGPSGQTNTAVGAQLRLGGQGTPDWTPARARDAVDAALEAYALPPAPSASPPGPSAQHTLPRVQPLPKK